MNRRDVLTRIARAVCVAIVALLACSNLAFGGTIAEQNFIDAVYQDLLHRPADPGGLAAYLFVLDSGGSAFDVAHAIDTTEEYYTDLVGSYYQSYLNRPADAGSNALVALLMAGGADAVAQADLLGSPEYFINRGAGDNSDFLNALYQDLLNRPADPGAIALFLPLLNAATPRSQVAAELLNSLEYNNDLVNGYFLRFLGRPAGSNGPHDVSELGVGATDETVIAQILGTPEFFALAQTQTATPEPGTFLLFAVGSGLVLTRAFGRRLLHTALRLSRAD
jgi:hypothetical protein